MSERRQPVNLRGQHDAGEIIGYAYRIYARHFRVMFGIALTTAPLQMLAAVVMERVGGEAGDYAAAPIQLAGFVVILIAVCALIRAVDDVAGGEAPDFNRSLDVGFARFWALLTTNVMAGALALLSVPVIPYFLIKRRWAAACSLPYFAIRWLLTPPAVVIDGTRHWGALDASARVVDGRWWRTLGIFLLIELVALAPLLAVSPVTYLPTLVATTGVAVAVALSLPFTATAFTLLYYDLRARAAEATAAGEPDVVVADILTGPTHRDDIDQ